jgi:hypothetical protein
MVVSLVQISGIRDDMRRMLTSVVSEMLPTDCSESARPVRELVSAGDGSLQAGVRRRHFFRNVANSRTDIIFLFATVNRRTGELNKIIHFGSDIGFSSPTYSSSPANCELLT